MRAATPQGICLGSCGVSGPLISPRGEARSSAATRAQRWCMVDGGSKGRGSRGRGTSSRGRGRGAEPPPPRPPPPRREEAPAHNHEPAAGADNVADDEDYLALAASITHMMRDEVASRDKLTKRVSELESALTAAQHAITPPPPLESPKFGSCAFSGRAWRLWVARCSQGRERPGRWAPSHCLECSSAPPLTPAAFSTYPGGTQGDGGPAHAQQRPTGAAA